MRREKVGITVINLVIRTKWGKTKQSMNLRT